eukprot:Colp12_sorted_trinity150504_noHs@35782
MATCVLNCPLRFQVPELKTRETEILLAGQFLINEHVLTGQGGLFLSLEVENSEDFSANLSFQFAQNAFLIKGFLQRFLELYKAGHAYRNYECRYRCDLFSVCHV